MSQKTLDPSVFDEQQFGQIRFAQQHQSWSVPSLEDFARPTEVYFRNLQSRASSLGDFKGAQFRG